MTYTLRAVELEIDEDEIELPVSCKYRLIDRDEQFALFAITDEAGIW